MLSGCATQVQIKTIEPSAISGVKQGMKISVNEFSNDRVGLSNKIESLLSSQKINDKNYFVLLSRKDLDRVLREQKLQSSGLLERDEAISIGNILGAEAFVSGNVTKARVDDSIYYENRIRCLDKKCKSVSNYSVSCTSREGVFSADIRVVDIQRSELIYAKTISKNSRWGHCYDDYGYFPSKDALLEELSSSVAAEFVSKLSPQYRYFNVELLDSEDIKYSKKASELLKSSISFIKAARYDRAYSLLLELVDETQEQSYVPFYNLGVIKEAEADYVEAKRYYEMSDVRTKEPIEAINEAIKRIDKLIMQDKIVKEQLK